MRCTEMQLDTSADDMIANGDIEDLDSLDTEGYLDLDVLAQFVDDMTYKLIHIDAPYWYMNIDFKTFRKRLDFDSIAACSPLTFAPGLGAVFGSPQAPSISYFMTLPLPPGECWAVYAIVMAKAGCKEELYIGSGTDAKNGVHSRLPQHKPGCSTAPVNVLKAFAQGYHVAHCGLLCWAPLPEAGLVPRVRARFLALEALFACLFHAMVAAVTDMYFEHMLLWPRDTAAWRPLCTHIPLLENISGDLGLSPHEIAIVDSIKKGNRKRYQKAHRAARKPEDPVAYRAHETAMKNIWAAKNRGRVNKTASKV